MITSRKNYCISIGMEFGALTVIGKQFYGANKFHKSIALIKCVCRCGKKCTVTCAELINGKLKSCGCRCHLHSKCKKWKCRVCGDMFISRNKMYSHYKENHSTGFSWNKGLTKETSESVKRSSETLHRHILDGIVIPRRGYRLTEKHKRKISVSMKIAHKEGRAHNIGICRWNNKPSYPEVFFMKVIENNFTDKNYKREFPFNRFSLDFAWESKKKCIEIDGEQHERFKEYKERDAEKDKMLKENGWYVFRIRWKDMCKNPKLWIKKAKIFIDGG